MLLVEDSPSDAMLFVELMAAGASPELDITHVELLGEALDLVGRGGGETFDVAVVDLNLPDSIGPETIRRLHAAAPDLPIIVLTGLADDAVGVTAIQHGAQDYIAKIDMQPRWLLRAMRYAIERAARRAQQRTLVATIADAVLVVSQDGRTRFANPAAGTLFGTSPAALLGQPFEYPVRVGETREIEVRTGSGKPRMAEMCVTAITWDGEPCALTSIRDITDRRRVAELRRYNSPAVVDWILARSDDDDEVDARRVTILFADLVGFTRLAEERPPVELSALLSEILSALTEIVFANGGTLDKYLGDGLMAVFGAPVTHGDHALRAVRTGHSMSCALDERLSSRLRSLGLELRVGIHTGRVVAGTIGSPQRLEYTVVGDAVNVAARLSAVCEPGEVLISEATFGELDGQFVCDPVGIRRLHNRRAEVPCYRVMGPGPPRP